MSRLDGIDLEDFLKISALTEGAESDDVEVDEDSYLGEDEDDDEDEDSIFDEEGDEEDSFVFSEEDDDDDDDVGDTESFPERRRRRRRRGLRRRRYRRVTPRRSLGRVRGSRFTTLRSPSGQRMRVRFGKRYASSAEVNKLIRDTEKKFADALKERKANFDRLSKQIARSTRDLNGRVGSVRKKVKKLEEQSRTSALMSLMTGPPKVKTINFTKPDASSGFEYGKDLTAEVEFEKPDMMLPLIMMGGLGGGSSDNMLLLALAFQKKGD